MQFRCQLSTFETRYLHICEVKWMRSMFDDRAYCAFQQQRHTQLTQQMIVNASIYENNRVSKQRRKPFLTSRFAIPTKNNAKIGKHIISLYDRRLTRQGYNYGAYIFQRSDHLRASTLAFFRIANNIQSNKPIISLIDTKTKGSSGIF